MRLVSILIAILAGMAFACAAYADEDVDKLAALLDKLPAEPKLEWIKKVEPDAIWLSDEGKVIFAAYRTTCAAISDTSSAISNRSFIKKFQRNNKNIEWRRDVVTPACCRVDDVSIKSKLVKIWIDVNSQSPEAKKSAAAKLQALKSEYADELNKLKAIVKTLQAELAKK